MTSAASSEFVRNLAPTARTATMASSVRYPVRLSRMRRSYSAARPDDLDNQGDAHPKSNVKV